MTTTRARTAKADDEAQTDTGEGVPVEETKRQNTLTMLDTMRDVIVGRVKVDIENKANDLRREFMAAVDGLAETVTELAKNMNADPTAAEDANTDQLDQLIDAKFSALFGLNATTLDGKPLADRFTDLLGDFSQHQVDVHDRVNKLAHDFGQTIAEVQKGAQVASLEAASATGVLRDVLAEKAPAILDSLRKVMEEVTYVPKGGTYDGGSSGNYKFRRFDDVAKELGEAFRRHSVWLRPKVISRETEKFEIEKTNYGKTYTQNWTDTRLRVAYTFVSLIDGSEQSITAEGEGRDLSDKSTSKAMTMALKTALTQAFMLPTDAPDPDSERPGDEPVHEDPHTNPADTDYPEEGPADPQTPPVNGKDPAARARDALTAARNTSVTRTQGDVVEIFSQAGKEKILSEKIDGITLQAHLLSIKSTLPPGEAQ